MCSSLLCSAFSPRRTNPKLTCPQLPPTMVSRPTHTRAHAHAHAHTHAHISKRRNSTSPRRLTKADSTKAGRKPKSKADTKERVKRAKGDRAQQLKAQDSSSSSSTMTLSSTSSPSGSSSVEIVSPPSVSGRKPTAKVSSSGGKARKKKSSKARWSPEEDARLRQAIKTHGPKNWKRVSELFPQRTDVQCQHRWQKVLNPSLHKGPWSKEEDQEVIRLVKKHGAFRTSPRLV